MFSENSMVKSAVEKITGKIRIGEWEFESIGFEIWKGIK